MEPLELRPLSLSALGRGRVQQVVCFVLLVLSTSGAPVKSEKGGREEETREQERGRERTYYSVRVPVERQNALPLSSSLP